MSMEYSIIKAMLGQYLGNIAIISRHPFFKGGRMKFEWIEDCFLKPPLHTESYLLEEVLLF